MRAVMNQCVPSGRPQVDSLAGVRPDPPRNVIRRGEEKTLYRTRLWYLWMLPDNNLTIFRGFKVCTIRYLILTMSFLHRLKYMEF
jgi:hypothetical protein